MSENLTPAEIRLAQYGERISTWSTATYDDGTEKALHEIALGLKAEVDRLRTALAREERLHGDTIDDRDRAQDAADKLAYAVASEDVIGEHTADNSPWANAIDLITSKVEVDKLRARVAELEGPAVEARAALAALCYDLEDPGSNALGALYLISRATVGVEAPRDDAATVLAQHDAQIMRRCAEFVRDTYDGDWADDAANTLERDADTHERGCPGFEKEYMGVSDAKRRLANCKHCGKPQAKHPVTAGPVVTP